MKLVLLIHFLAAAHFPLQTQGRSVTIGDGLHKFRTHKPISFTNYNTEKQIGEYVDYLGRTYPDRVKVITIGHSVEGRPIRAVNINKTLTAKPGIIIDAGIHAREWIAPAVALHILRELVENYDENRVLADSIDWTIIPLLNPDGYVYSMTVDRMWRKNRANTSDPLCPGVDLNRNFDLFFGGAGTSLDPCDETFTGSGPFSEPETRALRDYALSKGNTQLYLTLHSYGKYFLYPWGFGDTLPRDWKELDRLARVAEKALSSVYGTHYQVGSSTRLLGAAAGGSDDWMKARAGAKYSYTVELPGGGEKGFDLPAESIPYVSRELWEAVKLLGFFVAEEWR
ncbi:carboxypeptidase B [Halyomorpha halys]|uniref:carboxypeptidase B n=1 Tax=Halyomorpha halys TaxID=286706 RepID=UPI0006D4CE88|nr:carboxypeptidase B-like [Halyomorpha halys]